MTTPGNPPSPLFRLVVFLQAFVFALALVRRTVRSLVSVRRGGACVSGCITVATSRNRAAGLCR